MFQHYTLKNGTFKDELQNYNAIAGLTEIKRKKKKRK